MEVAAPLTVHMDGPSFPMMEQAEQPLATTSTQPQIQQSDFQQDFFSHPARRIQPQRQRQGRFGTNDLDAYILKHLDREAQQRAVIPAETILYFSTDSSLVPDPDTVVDIIDERFGLSKQLPETNNDGDDFKPTGNYFRSKEVMHKIRRQQIIETPLFSEITDEARQSAYAAIPLTMLEEEVDRSDDAYNASHSAPLKKEQHVRVSETDNFKYRRHRLKDRIKQLSGLDSSYFRGDTNEEQERDRELVLAAAVEMLEQIDGTKQGEGSDEEFEENTDGQPRVNGVHGSKKSNKKQQSAHQEDLDESGAAAPKPEKKKRKISSYLYWDDHEIVQDVINATMNPLLEDEDDRPMKKPKKKIHGASKKGATLGKRKRVPEVDMDPEEYEEHDYDRITPAPSTKRHKSEASSHVRLPSHSLPPSNPARNEKNSGLLDQARKYNPDRPSRDVNPFGAPFDWKLVLVKRLDFQLPECVVLEEKEDGDEDELGSKDEDEDGESAGGDAAVRAKTDAVESVLTEDIEGEDEIVQNGRSWDQNAGDSSSPLSSVDDDDEDDGETEPGL